MRTRFSVYIFTILLSFSIRIYCQDMEMTRENIRELVIKADYSGIEALDWKKLISEGLMFNWDFDKEINPLSLAVERKDYGMIKILLSKGVPQEYWIDQDALSYLADSIEAGETEIVSSLIESGLLPNLSDLFRCDKDDDLEIMKLILPLLKNPLERFKITEWGEPIGGTTSYIRFLVQQKEGDILLSTLLKANPNILDIVYSDYSAAYGPWQVSHFTLADMAGEWMKINVPELKARTVQEVLVSTKYVDIKKYFPNSFLAMTTDRLKLRTSPELSSTVILVLDMGSEVTVIESDITSGPKEIDGVSSAWYYIVTPKGERGWVWGGYLKPISMP